MIGGGYPLAGGLVLYPVVAPALILVGTMMIGGVRSIDWDDPTESIPAFLTIVIMPLAVSITDGIAFGFIAYAVLKLATGRASEAHWLVYLFAVLFVLRYALLA
jgi:AGZA family xanthine/uracil permease-like MFS transporter